MINTNPEITEAEARALIPDSDALYNACLRNQYVMPPLKDSLVTKDFIMSVFRSKTVWCPKSSDIQYRVCADVPPKKMLAEIVFNQMQSTNVPEDMRQAFQNTASLIMKNPPSTSWLLLVLATLN